MASANQERHGADAGKVQSLSPRRDCAGFHDSSVDADAALVALAPGCRLDALSSNIQLSCRALDFRGSAKSALGQSRPFDLGPVTSGLSPTSDMSLRRAN